MSYSLLSVEYKVDDIALDWNVVIPNDHHIPRATSVQDALATLKQRNPTATIVNYYFTTTQIHSVLL